VDITQTTDYYPGGSVLSHWEKEDYRFGYQGQYAEEDEETGFNHFEAREYDSKINRWLVPDPAKQFASPYNGMGNNPINGVDPNGERVWFWFMQIEAKGGVNPYGPGYNNNQMTGFAYDDIGKISFTVHDEHQAVSAQKHSPGNMGTDIVLGGGTGVEWGFLYDGKRTNFIDAANAHNRTYDVTVIDVTSGDGQFGLAGGLTIGASYSSVAWKNIRFFAFLPDELARVTGGWTGITNDRWNVYTGEDGFEYLQYRDSGSEFIKTDLRLHKVGKEGYMTDGYRAGYDKLQNE
ncbi:RHS repeat-associated core domain-containing protein, partial [Reichenbachiella sp. MALMAid0571]|uniref:RHS repeat protein n=1 Tax=Reichenbachiella sp. MALMAid0571 TaxID=3143939 RepID=UPI0032DF179F